MMLVAILILQVFITQILSQMHQQVQAQLNPAPYPLPVAIQKKVQTCLEGMCEQGVRVVTVKALGVSPERQFFNAALSLCENKECYLIEQVFSDGSAILKEDRRYHSVTVTSN